MGVNDERGSAEARRKRERQWQVKQAAKVHGRLDD